MTAELLKWWFQSDFQDASALQFPSRAASGAPQCDLCPRSTGVNTLQDLYQAAAPDVMLASARDAEVIRAPKNAYPKYCLKMATGTGKTWVLQALMIWQMLNAQSRSPTANATPEISLSLRLGLIVYDRLLDAFMGKERDGRRDFSISDLAIFQELFIPDAYRDEVFRFVQGAICPKDDIGRKVTAGGIIAIANWHVLSEEGEQHEDEDIDAPREVNRPQEDRRERASADTGHEQRQ